MPQGASSVSGRDGSLEEGEEHKVQLELPLDARSGAVWRQWLLSMATDAEAALSAAIAYRDLDSEGRERWLTSLKADAPHVKVPAIALYAPLVAVEEDPERRTRLILEMGDEQSESARAQARALVGNTRAAVRVYVLATPLYLDFVQVLACGVTDKGFSWVRHDPIAFGEKVPSPGEEFEGASLEAAPIKSVLDDLASAVLAHRRSGRALPDALGVLGELLECLAP